MCDPIGSHLVQAALSNASSDFVNVFWANSVSKSLPELLVHPIANFVISAAIEKVGMKDLGDVLGVSADTWQKSISKSASGERIARYNDSQRTPGPDHLGR